ncbi:hypothetical protein ACLK17_23530 [Escherichia coli]
MGRLIDYASRTTLTSVPFRWWYWTKPIAVRFGFYLKISCWLFRRMPPANQRLNMPSAATLSYRVRELAFEQMNNAEYIEVEPEQKRATVLKKSFTLLTKKKCVCCKR